MGTVLPDSVLYSYKDELVHIKPLAKFFMFKSIVFLTWWQGVGIILLSYLSSICLGVLQPKGYSLSQGSKISSFV
uniref:Uncharacterized protein n=1 Tax=Cucumis melo TaxID=3656 RepID=A0A9I9D9B5_CUCME